MRALRQIAAALVLGAATVALAAPPHEAAAHSQAVRDACTDDYMRLCANFDPDSKKGSACMRRNQKRLSTACQQALLKSGHGSGTKSTKR